MICLHAEYSHLCTFALLIYTCILIPFLKTKHVLFRIFTFLTDPHNQPGMMSRFDESPIWELDLPVTRFKDMELISHKNDEEICSICLMEFEEEDFVNKLPRCGHVFHMECMEKWTDRCQFTCPLCRSSVLHASYNNSSSTSCTTWDFPFRILPAP